MGVERHADGHGQSYGAADGYGFCLRKFASFRNRDYESRYDWSDRNRLYDCQCHLFQRDGASAYGDLCGNWSRDSEQHTGGAGVFDDLQRQLSEWKSGYVDRYSERLNLRWLDRL